ncbi:MAG: tRNA (cytidine(34)-2'-O)-methyltransferase [Elusimicrobia bacterium]|nr:tRNA (cytidine(34)-2'-O)-methyltransferase [Elusimicrobiota bacterium]
MNVVLFEPEIPWNTGSVGRTCVAAGAVLHLIEPLGFQVTSREIRRSGLDYWARLRLVRHENLEAFLASLPPDPSVLVFTTKASRSFRQAPYRRDSYLLFGKESSGLPERVLSRFRDRLFRIPVGRDVRSLNLSVAAAVAVYEGLGRLGADPA